MYTSYCVIYGTKCSFHCVQRIFELDSMAMPHEYIFMDEAGFNLAKRRRGGCNVIGQRAIIELASVVDM